MSERTHVESFAIIELIAEAINDSLEPEWRRLPCGAVDRGRWSGDHCHAEARHRMSVVPRRLPPPQYVDGERAEQLLSLRKADVMREFLVIADMDDGTFAVLSIDPTQRVGAGLRAIVLSVHEDRGDAEVALQEMSNDHRH